MSYRAPLRSDFRIEKITLRLRPTWILTTILRLSHLAAVILIAAILDSQFSLPLSGEEPVCAVQSPRPIKSLKRLEETVKRFGGYGDNWHMSWAKDDKVYVSLRDGDGLPGTPPAKLNWKFE